MLLNYQTQLGAVVKQSGPSVCTRSNLVGDAWPIAENAALRATGTNFVDFYGNDTRTHVVTRTAAGQAFAVPTAIGSVTSAQTGFYNADNVWVQQGSKSYTVSGSTIVVKPAKNECVLVVVS